MCSLAFTIWVASSPFAAAGQRRSIVSSASAAMAPAVGALVDVFAADAEPASAAALWPLGLLALPVLAARASASSSPR